MNTVEYTPEQLLAEILRLRSVQSQQAKKIRGLREAVNAKESCLLRTKRKNAELLARIKAVNGDDDEFRRLLAAREREIEAAKTKAKHWEFHYDNSMVRIKDLYREMGRCQ